MKDSKERFSDRAEDYARYRPGYPAEVTSFLKDKCALTNDSVVADVGSGTGNLSVLFLEHGNKVLAVEPNDEMRRAAETSFGDHPGFESVAGSAEATTLADDSVDLAVIGNSLHWVDRSAARTEFSRILEPEGHVAVVWSIAKKTGTPFLEAYNRLMSGYRTDDGAGGNSEDVYEMTEVFFGEGSDEQRFYEVGSFPYSQHLDFEGLKGLVLSSSSMPASSEPGSEEMTRDLEEVFHDYESGGEVVLEYAVRVYCGRLL